MITPEEIRNDALEEAAHLVANARCLPTCDSFAHDLACPVVYPEVAIRALKSPINAEGQVVATTGELGDAEASAPQQTNLGKLLRDAIDRGFIPNAAPQMPTMATSGSKELGAVSTASGVEPLSKMPCVASPAAAAPGEAPADALEKHRGPVTAAVTAELIYNAITWCNKDFSQVEDVVEDAQFLLTDCAKELQRLERERDALRRQVAEKPWTS